jgi:hypothetical protein
VYGGNFFSIKSTSKKLSVACQESSIPADIPAGTRAEKGWSCLKVEGPLDFGLTGILAGISRTLAENGVSLFAISTYDTDYILVRETDLEHAAGTLKKEYGIQKP